MKLRNSLALTLAAAMFAGAAVPSFTFAAPPQGDHQPAGHGGPMRLMAIETAANSDAVKLDDEQKSKVHSIIEDAIAQAKSMRQDAKAAGDASKDDKKDNRDKMTELVTQTQDRVEAVLTDTQKTAFREALKAERAKMRDARGDRPAAGKKGDKKPA